MQAKTFFHASRRGCQLLLLSCLGAVAGQAQIYYARELNTEQYKKLDRAKTVVVIPLGIMEEHGPYIPADTDGYIAEKVADEVAAAVVRKGYKALMFPFIPLGTDAMNEVPGRRPWPGSFVVRSQTFRAMMMDLVSNIGEAGFRKVFVSNGHGAPTHNRMLTQVTAYFNETFPDGHMAVLGGFGGPRVSSPEAMKLNQEALALLSPEAKKEQGGHADIDETSIMLHLQPNLVDPAYVNAPDNGWNMMNKPEWLGYLGSPKHSTAQIGALKLKARFETAIAQVYAVLDGTAPKPGPIQPTADTSIDPAHKAILARDIELEKKQQEWITKKGLK